MRKVTQMTVEFSYGFYLIICIAITIWVARMLRKDAPVLIESANDGRSEVNAAITRLLIVGFYLVNLGVICVALKYGEKAVDLASAIELLSTKIGIILVALGAAHFGILAKLFRIKRDALLMARRHRLDTDATA
jgi:hypothetical protein